MLAVLGAAFGVVDPIAAAVAGGVAAAVQIVTCGLARRRQLLFAPALLVGFLAGTAATWWLPQGAYRDRVKAGSGVGGRRYCGRGFLRWDH
jgi:hypothetical protein